MPGTTYFGEAEPAVEGLSTTDASVTVTPVIGTAVIPAVTVSTTGGAVDAAVTVTPVVGTAVIPEPTVYTYVPGAGGDGGSHHGRRRRHSGS